MDGFTAGPATPPTPSRLGLPEIWLPLWLQLQLQLQLQLPQGPPPQPAEHPPRYTQAIASPPGPLKPCNINGLKGKSAP